MELTAEAKAARTAYFAEYRRTHRERIREKAKAWRAANPDKVQAANKKYWENQAKKGGFTDSADH